MTYRGTCPAINLSSHSAKAPAKKTEQAFCPLPGCTAPIWRESGLCGNHAGAFGPLRVPLSELSSMPAEPVKTASAPRIGARAYKLPPGRRRGPSSRPARELILAFAWELSAEAIAPESKLVFAMARAAGAVFRDAEGRIWLAGRPRGPRPRIAFEPFEEPDRSRRLLLAAFKAVKQVEGKPVVARARRAARAAGARFDDHAGRKWLERFTAGRVVPANLRQSRPPSRPVAAALTGFRAAR
jgi:hypothetical protein